MIVRWNWIFLCPAVPTSKTAEIAGRLGQRTPHGVNYAAAGQTMNGHAADMPMEVFNGGKTDVTALIMFVVDATRPFSTPAKMP